MTHSPFARLGTRPLLLVVIMSAMGSRDARSEQLLYLASTKDKSIVAHAIDSATGGLKKRFEVTLPGNAGPLTFSRNNDFVYAAVTGLDDGKAGVTTLKRNADGSLEILATATITSRAPYIRADPSGRFLLAAHYGAGEVTMYRIKDGICTDELLDRHVTDKTAHCIEIDPSGRFVFVPHTSPNKVFQFRLDPKSEKLVPNDPPFANGPDMDHLYHQPRHYAHHPKLNMAFTSNERGGGISAWKFDTEKGTLTLAQTLNTLPPNYEGDSAAADVRLTPDGRFAFVSNRDVTKRDKEPARDTIAAIAIDADSGAMKIIGQYPTAKFPRSICIDQTGNYLYAAGQRSAELFAYRIERDTGKLTYLETHQTGGTPIWVECRHTEK
jgi:6-phosphogluconolactonase